jgi:GR25 family glycosyltransferase involved in LPS biosynthesis
MAKLTHKVFHSAKATQRQKYVDKANALFKDGSVELDTPTILIEDAKDLKAFLDANPDFKVDLAGYSFKGAPKGWRYEEIGIWASNVLAWKAFLASDADYVVLMEDDIIFNAKDLLWIDEALAALPADWDQYHPFSFAGEWPKYKPEVNDGPIVKAYQSWSNVCYLLNKKGAAKLLSNLETNLIKLPLDAWWFWPESELIDFNVYTIKPVLKPVCRLPFGELTTFQTKPYKDLTNYELELE